MDISGIVGWLCAFIGGVLLGSVLYSSFDFFILFVAIVFWDVKTTDKELLEEIREYESKNCPALKKISIEKIFESLRGREQT